MNILFMCVANSARSQLAEGLARKILAGHRIESAGSLPLRVNPLAIEALREVGIDISSHRSKAVKDLPKDFVDSLDYVITLCAEEVCPAVVSKAKRLHWPLPDPAGGGIEKFRAIRDDLAARVDAFKASNLSG